MEIYEAYKKAIDNECENDRGNCPISPSCKECIPYMPFEDFKEQYIKYLDLKIEKT